MIVCARCGHEESEGVWFASESDRTAAALPPEAARWLGEESRDRGQLLRTLDFPVFALAASRPRGAVSGWGRDGDRLSSVTVRHHRRGRLVQVESEHRRRAVSGACEAARHALEGALDEPGRWPRVSPPALSLWLRLRHRKRHGQAVRATSEHVVRSVNGEPVTFCACARTLRGRRSPTSAPSA